MKSGTIYPCFSILFLKKNPEKSGFFIGSTYSPLKNTQKSVFFVGTASKEYGKWRD
jgi:hypothetical protein